MVCAGVPPDVLIVEATFGIRTHEERGAREKRLMEMLRRVVERAGHVLLPLSAFGRSQEIMLMIDEYWEANPELHSIPVYYAAPMAVKALQLYKAFSSYMTRSLQAKMASRNPWDFRFIRPLRDIESVTSGGPCVVIAAPGMLQGGLSRALFEKWCENTADACIIAGYCVEGTLGKEILRNPREVTALSGRKLALACDVDEVQFAAHADYAQTSALVETLQPQTIVLVHGEATEMRRLHQALVKRHVKADSGNGVFMPPNQSSVRRWFRQDRATKAVGMLAEAPLEPGEPVKGVLVRRAFSLSLVHESQVSQFTPLSKHEINQRLVLPFRAPWSVARHYLFSVFEDVLDLKLDDGKDRVLVSGLVTVAGHSKDRLVLEWQVSPASDLVADTAVAVLTQAEFSPMSLEATLVDCCPPAPGVAPGVAAAHEAALGRSCCFPLDKPPATLVDEEEVAALPPVAENPVGLSDPVLGTEGYAALEAWKAKREEEARVRAKQMLVGALQAWFGCTAVEASDKDVVVRVEEGEVRVDCEAWTAEASATAEGDGMLMESVRLALAHVRETALRRV
jgi:hypothetical protein